MKENTSNENEKTDLTVKEGSQNQQIQSHNTTRNKSNLSDKKDLSNEILYFSINQESK